MPAAVHTWALCNGSLIAELILGPNSECPPMLLLLYMLNILFFSIAALCYTSTIRQSGAQSLPIDCTMHGTSQIPSIVLCTLV